LFNVFQTSTDKPSVTLTVCTGSLGFNLVNYRGSP